MPFGCENENTSCPLLAIALIPTKDSKCQTADVAQRRENFEQRPCGVTFLNTEVGVLKPLRLDALIGDTTTRTSWRLTARMATLPVYEAHPLFANYVLDPMTVSALLPEKKSVLSSITTTRNTQIRKTAPQMAAGNFSTS